jgi:hypothetical protein
MSNMQTILMMTDVSGHCFWLCDYSDREYYKHTLLEIEKLPLSFDLNDQLTEWMDNLQYEDDECLEPISPELFTNNFDVVGKQLWQLVKEELKDKYKVVYYSEVEQKVLDD